MNVKKNENQSEGFQKKYYVGLVEAKVVAINPDREELIKLLDVAEEHHDKFKDIEYLGETQDGEAKLNIDIYMREAKTQELFKMRYTFVDKKLLSKDGKPAYINQLGDTQYVENKKDLFDSFTHFTKINSWKGVDGDIGPKYTTGARPEEVIVMADKSYREAYDGERDFYGKFMKNWLSKVDFYDVDTDILLDWKKTMRNNLKDLKGLVDSELVGNLLVAITVGKDKDDESKLYQKVYNRAILPASKLKILRTQGKSSTDKAIKSFFADLTGEHGTKDSYSTEIGLKEYTGEEVTTEISADDSKY